MLPTSVKRVHLHQLQPGDIVGQAGHCAMCVAIWWEKEDVWDLDTVTRALGNKLTIVFLNETRIVRNVYYSSEELFKITLVKRST